MRRTEFRRLITAGQQWQSNGTWRYVNGLMVNNPTLSAELLTNTEFATDTSGWTAINTATLTRRNFASSPNIAPTGGSDNFGLEVASGGNSQAAARQQPTVAVGAWLRVFARAYSPSANTGVGIATITNSRSTVAEDVWEDLLDIDRNTANPASVIFRAASTAAGDVAYFDALSAKTLTLNELLLSTYWPAETLRSVSARLYMQRGAVAGVFCNLDSLSNPQNFILAYWNSLTAKVVKCVAGVYTQLISTGVSNEVGAPFELRRTSPTTYQLWLRGSQRGADQTVSDAGIISNTLHGGFSTSNGCYLQNLRVS